MTKLENQKIKPEKYNYPKVSNGESCADESMNHLQDVEIPLEIVFGKTRLPIMEFLKLKTGSVITLDKVLGEPVDLEANGTTVAYGEIVVVDDHYGVKITQVI